MVISKITMRLLKLGVSATLLTVLLRVVEWPQVLAAARQLDPAWLALSLLLFVPQTVVSAWRWQKLIAPLSSITLVESVWHTLAASALNLIAPAKTGDFSKAAWLPSLTPAQRAKAGGRILVEKGCDVVCLFACMAFGVEMHLALGVMALLIVAVAVVSRDRLRSVWCLVLGVWQSREHETQNTKHKTLAPLVLFSTLALWCLHLAQVHLFLLAAGVNASLETTLSRVPLALFAGLVPGTFCGIGTRDSALVWLYADIAPAATMAVVGLLTSLRYLVPGAAGVVVFAMSSRVSRGHETVEIAAPSHAPAS